LNLSKRIFWHNEAPATYLPPAASAHRNEVSVSADDNFVIDDAVIDFDILSA